MSSESVDLVRSSFEAHRRAGIEAVTPFYTEDCLWDAGSEWFEARFYHGHDGLRRIDAVFGSNFEDYALEVHEIRAAGEQVLALYEVTGRMPGSGLALRQQMGLTFAFTDGKIAEIRSFFSWREALASLGLEE